MNYDELKREYRKYQPQMTAAERSQAYHKGETVDFQPYKIQAAESAIGAMYGFTQRDMTSPDVMCEVLRRKKQDFGLESYTVGFGLRSFACAMGSVQEMPEHGLSYIKDYCVMDYRDFYQMELPDPYQNKKLYGSIEKAKKLRELFPTYSMRVSLSGPFSTASAMRPIEYLLKDIRKNPEELHALLQFTVDGQLEWLRAFKKEVGLTTVSFSDPVTCLDVLGKKYYLEFSHPYIKRLIDGIHEIMGEYPEAHICGKTSGIWEELADAGLASISLDDREDLAEAKRAIGSRMILSGNVPPVDVMKHGTIDDVIKAVCSCLEKGADSPRGYLVNTGCQLPIGTPMANAKAYVYAIRKYGKDAKLGMLPKGLECYQNEFKGY